MFSMFKNNKYNGTALLGWFAYFLHGIQSIILTQNIDYFSDMWSTTAAGVMGVIAWTGIGKIVFHLIAGNTADRIGRKPVALSGLVGYIILFVVLLFNTNLTIAYVVSFIGGAATSLFDGSLNPMFMESYPNDKSVATILNKGFISLSGTIYPLFIGLLTQNMIPRYWAIIVPLILTIIVFLFMFFAPFPDNDIKKEENVSAKEAVRILEERQAEETVTLQHIEKPTWFDWITIAIYGFAIYGTFYLFQQVITLYSTEVLNLSAIAAQANQSYYNIGAFVAVVISAVIMSGGVRDMLLMVIHPFASAIAALIMFFYPTQLTLAVGSFVIGYSASGGMLQLGGSLINQFFPQNKGRNTSTYYFITALASYIMPQLASYLIATDFTKLMLADGIVASIAFILSLIIAYRYKKIFGVSPFSKTK